MNNLYQEWQEYIEITSKYSEVCYKDLDLVKIEKKKSAWVGAAIQMKD